MQLDEFGALAALGGFLRRGEFAFRQRDAAFDGYGFYGFRKGDVFDFLDEGEDVSGLVTAKAVVELASHIDREGWALFRVEGAEAGVVLRAGALEAHVFADDLEDVRLLLYGLGEVVGHMSYIFKIIGEQNLRRLRLTAAA